MCRIWGIHPRVEQRLSLSLYPSFFGPGGRISPPPHSVLKWIEWKLKNLGFTAPTTGGVNWNPGSKQQLWKIHHTKTGAKVSLSPLVPFFASCFALLARTQQQINNSWYKLTRHLSDRLVHRYLGRSRRLCHYMAQRVAVWAQQSNM